MSTAGLAGVRLLVVGASSGIGRAIAVAAAARGAHVAAAGRRTDRLQSLGAQAAAVASARARAPDDRPEATPFPAPAITAITADVRRDDDCDRLVDEALNALGGLDALVYATGVSTLSTLRTTDGDVWRTVLETNVVGAALVTRAAIDHLAESHGRAAYLSSVSSEDPRPALVPYGSSKAALDAMIRGWRNEHPTIAFLRIVVGPTSGTEFASAWDPAALAGFFEARAGRGQARASEMTPAEVADEVLRVLISPVWTEDLRLLPSNAPIAPGRPSATGDPVTGHQATGDPHGASLE